MYRLTLPIKMTDYIDDPRPCTEYPKELLTSGLRLHYPHTCLFIRNYGSYWRQNLIKTYLVLPQSFVCLVTLSPHHSFRHPVSQCKLLMSPNFPMMQCPVFPASTQQAESQVPHFRNSCNRSQLDSAGLI